MAIIAHVVLSDISPEQYNNLRAETGWLEHAPDGGMVHLTWWEGANCHNIDAWESEEQFGRFGAERLGPAMERLGMNVEPQITLHPAHEVFMPEAVTVV